MKNSKNKVSRVKKLWDEYRVGKMFGNTWTIIEEFYLYQTTRLDQQTCKDIIMNNNQSTYEDGALRLIPRPKQGSSRWIEMVEIPQWFKDYEIDNGFPWLDD